MLERALSLLLLKGSEGGRAWQRNHLGSALVAKNILGHCVHNALLGSSSVLSQKQRDQILEFLQEVVIAHGIVHLGQGSFLQPKAITLTNAKWLLLLIPGVESISALFLNGRTGWHSTASTAYYNSFSHCPGVPLGSVLKDEKEGE